MHNFERNEIFLVCDALGGALLRQETGLYPNQPLGEWVHDRIIEDELDRKWHVKRDLVIEKLDALDSIKARNLIDAAKQLHLLREEGSSEDGALHRAGLN
jgi:hypothetical protein